jgi:histone-arginine methyltransferase CARM1
LSCLRAAAMKEYFRQPIVDTFDIRICTAKSVRHVVDFHTASESDLHRMGMYFFHRVVVVGITFLKLFLFLYLRYPARISCPSVWLSSRIGLLV